MMDIQAAKARCEAATEGDWRWEVVRGTWELVSPSGYILSAQLDFDRSPRMIAKHGWDDAEFISHARSDLPAALEALEEAQGKLEEVRDAADVCGIACWVHTVLPTQAMPVERSKEGNE